MNLKRIYSQMLLAVLLLTGTSFAQESPGLRERAEQLYREYRYAQAVPIYQQLVDVKKPRLADLERLAASYLKMNDYESAENWYARVTTHPDSPAENLLKYAEVLKANARYTQAREVLETYVVKTGNLERVAIAIAGCDSARAWLAAPTMHKLNTLIGINTERAEFAAYPVNELVYYTAEPMLESGKKEYGWTGQGFLRIFTDRLSGSDWGIPTEVTEVFNKAPAHVGPLAINRTGDTYYITRTYTKDRDAEKSREYGKTYQINNLELFLYQKDLSGQWAEQPFPYNNVKAYSVGHAALSTDDQTLYFISNMPGGLGGTDIWYCERQADGTWGVPQNAGSVINTAGDELFPGIALDGTLYYSSDGLTGMGGLDIYRSMGNKDEWSVPVNMRYPVNSGADDFAYFVKEIREEGVSGFLSSNRRGGMGSDDIYAFNYFRPKILLALKGLTYDKGTRALLPEAVVSLYANGRTLKARKDSKPDGGFFFELETGTDYRIIGQKVKYHADSAQVSTKGLTWSDTLEVALYLEPIFEAGKTFELKNIHYDFDKHHIRLDAAAILDELVRTLRDNPTLKIELSSHTDSRGSDAYNMALSQRRAQSAVDYLVSRGIARDRMEATGYGESRLLNRCSNGVPCSKAEHQANRRTEVTVLEY